MAESYVHLRRLHRGPTTTLIYTIFNIDQGDPNLLSYDQIDNIDNLIMIKVNFEKGKHGMNPVLSMKTKGVQITPIPVTIQCREFKAEFFCATEWIYIQLDPVPCTYAKKFLHLYIVEINATIQFKSPKAILPLKDLYEDESTDFQLHAADGTIAVHKAVLFLHSNMFKMMLTREWMESNEGRITMDGITVETLQHLKDYMYLGILPDTGLEPLLQVAAHYFMDKLKADCSEKLLISVKAENVDNLIALACEFNVPELARALILRVPDDVLNGWYDLDINKSGQSDQANLNVTEMTKE